MKQRVRLALTMYSYVPLVLLDEPTSNLDPEGKIWYKNLIEHTLRQRSILVASNFYADEYYFAKEEIALHKFR
jgi:ABC-type multidrug transport system ATPase subunit